MIVKNPKKDASPLHRGGRRKSRLAAGYLLMLRYFETGLLRPQQSRRPTPEPSIRIDVGDGKKIAAIYLPAPDPEAKTILYSYGNLENLEGKLELLGEFHRRGYGVIGYDSDHPETPGQGVLEILADFLRNSGGQKEAAGLLPTASDFGERPVVEHVAQRLPGGDRRYPICSILPDNALIPA